MTEPKFSIGDRVEYRTNSVMAMREFRQHGPAPIAFAAIVTDVGERYHVPAYCLVLLDGGTLAALECELTLVEAAAVAPATDEPTEAVAA